MTAPVQVNGQWVIVSPTTGQTHACATQKAAEALAASLAQKHREASRWETAR